MKALYAVTFFAIAVCMSFAAYLAWDMPTSPGCQDHTPSGETLWVTRVARGAGQLVATGETSTGPDGKEVQVYQRGDADVPSPVSVCSRCGALFTSPSK